MTSRNPKGGKELDALDKMIEEITVDAYGDDEQLWSFRQAFEDNVDLQGIFGMPPLNYNIHDGSKKKLII
jgi:hypothetical protein